MRERAQDLLRRQGAADAANAVRISTFHSLGLSIVRAEHRALGLRSGFSILDPSDLESIVGELAASADRGRTRAIQWKISQWKNALVSPEEALSAAADDAERIAARAYLGYAEALRRLPGGRFRRPDRAARRPFSTTMQPRASAGRRAARTC